MLKLTYTENSLSLDYLNVPLENWVSTRVSLALSTGAYIYMEPSTAAFLLPIESLAVLEKLAEENLIEFCLCDSSWLEVTLQGIWITSTPKSETGVFITALSPSAELLFQQLSQSQQLCHA
ncbi:MULTISPECIES: alr0857 family protein [unclassified Nostoc]|uniref:alr0857 family protein n=1 Tax=unclassified Nostoc TaxID=2593658 RepID=UPI002AD2F882|nr:MULTISPECIES: alr0857 family protein [unclassified Nostoc]MDZ7956193.1 hypothetical protein [Nostoc sp. DedQUE09]MDZ8096911.1 hypothetical protein [Nostoc sp. DedQUE05]